MPDQACDIAVGLPPLRLDFIIPKLEIRKKSDISANYTLHSNSLNIDIGSEGCGEHRYSRYVHFTLPELEEMIKFARVERFRQKKEAEQAAKKNLKLVQAL